MGGVLERFPALKLVFVEPGIGWMGWWLNLVDDMVLRQLRTTRDQRAPHRSRNVFTTLVRTGTLE